jgi:hypothetical protein
MGGGGGVANGNKKRKKERLRQHWKLQEDKVTDKQFFWHGLKQSLAGTKI